MTDRDTLPRDDIGRLVVPQPFPAAARVFGLLFALPGLKLGWGFIQGVIEVARAGAWQPSDVLSFGVWLLIVLVFLLPGWIIATIRRKVVIDHGHRTVLQVNDFLVYRWSSSRPLNEFNAVRLYIAPPSSSTSRRAGVSHHVALIGPSGKELLTYIEDSEDDARAVAREIASVCGLPFRDEVHDAARDDADDSDDDPAADGTG